VIDDQQRQTASEIERSRPSWLVMWGCYSRLFWAFPRFDVPKGTIISASNRDQLLVDMDSVEVEQSAAARGPVYAAPTAASALPRRPSRWRVEPGSSTGAGPGLLSTPQAMPQPANRSYEPYVPDRDNQDAEPHYPGLYEADRPDLDPYEADRPDLDPYEADRPDLDPYGDLEDPYDHDPYSSAQG
jgi:hypothetical protein